LAEAYHGGIMKRHIGILPPHAPSGRTQSKAKFRILSRNEIIAVAIHAIKSCCTQHNVAAKRSDIADRTIPFSITQPVIDRCSGEAFASPTAHGADIRMRIQEGDGLIEPGQIQLTIPVYKLHIGNVRR
jgi:hypothetical protein